MCIYCMCNIYSHSNNNEEYVAMKGVSMLKPMEDWMILDLVGDKSKPTSIVMPDGFEAENDENAVFVVKAVGPGYRTVDGMFVDSDVDLDIHNGDLVVITNYGMSKFKYQGEKVILAKARDVVMKIVGEV